MAPGKPASRRASRRAAFVLLYQADLLGQPLDDLAARVEADDGAELDAYARNAAEGALARAKELDLAIDAAAHGWSVERIGVVERAIMRLALWELLERDDVPRAVAISEAVELAKRYAGPDAASFVNGVLASAARTLEQAG